MREKGDFGAKVPWAVRALKARYVRGERFLDLVNMLRGSCELFKGEEFVAQRISVCRALNSFKEHVAKRKTFAEDCLRAVWLDAFGAALIKSYWAISVINVLYYSGAFAG